MHHALHFPTFIFILYVCPCFPFFLTNHNWKRVLLIMWDIFFETQRYFFALFNFLKMVILTTLCRHWSTLQKSTLKITTLFRRCLTLWRCSALQISTLTYAALFQSWFDIIRCRNVISPWQQRWDNVEVFAGYWRTLLKDYIILKNFIKLKTYILSRVPLNYRFRKFLKRYWWNNFDSKKFKKKTEKKVKREKKTLFK